MEYSQNSSIFSFSKPGINSSPQNAPLLVFLLRSSFGNSKTNFRNTFVYNFVDGIHLQPPMGTVRRCLQNNRESLYFFVLVSNVVIVTCLWKSFKGLDSEGIK